MSRYLLPLIAVIGLILFLIVGLKRGDPRALPSPYIGKPAPEFELPKLKDPDQTVEKLLKAAGAKVNNFYRFEVGEGIEKKQENFADEVMAQINAS